MVRRAFERAATAHNGQHRLSGEDYVNHPLEVAAILADLELDAATIAAVDPLPFVPATWMIGISRWPARISACSAGKICL